MNATPVWSSCSLTVARLTHPTGRRLSSISARSSRSFCPQTSDQTQSFDLGVSASLKHGYLQRIMIRTVSRQTAQVIRILDSWQRAGFPRVIVSAFRAAGFVPDIGQDNHYSLTMKRSAATKVRHWSSAPHVEDGELLVNNKITALIVYQLVHGQPEDHSVQSGRVLRHRNVDVLGNRLEFVGDRGIVASLPIGARRMDKRRCQTGGATQLDAVESGLQSTF
jgi:hypothetical protein